MSDTEGKHVCIHNPAKRGNFIVCVCGDRFPCAERDCGHRMCWEERGKAPVCHFCQGALKGDHGTEDSTWGILSVRGKTRAGHYCCRDANSTTPRKDIACRAKGGSMPDECEHEFEGKQPLTKDMVRQLADNYVRE